MESSRKKQDKKEVQRECTCNKAKVIAMLLALPKEEFTELAQDPVTEVLCDFCNKSYKFTSEELLKLKAEKNK